jgi:ribulose-phosphate 3-epimerase
VKLSASLFAADPFRLEAQLEAVEPHVDSFHVDIIDGRFAPAFGLGERIVQTLVRARSKPVDVHLMIENPAYWAPRFAALGARIVAVHTESGADVASALRSVRKEGALAYLALRPDTPVSGVQRLIDDADGALLLTAPAGGGAFIAAALQKTFDLPRAYPSIIDGRVEESHFEVACAAGVDLAVMGHSLFSHEDISVRADALAAKLRELAKA